MATKTTKVEADFSKNKHGDTLVFAHVIFRHGARNVSKSAFPNNPYIEPHHVPEGFSELTLEGRRQAYDFGVYLRRRYGHFLNHYHSYRRVHVQSTEVDRTIMSAQSCTAGMFPATGIEKWHPEYTWQPVPVRTIPLADDYVLWVMIDCPRFKQLWEQFEKEDPVVLDYFQRFEDHFKRWSEKSGKNIKTMSDVYELYVALDIIRSQGRQIPEWAVEDMKTNSPLYQLATYQLSMKTATKELATFTSGYFIQEMLQRFQDKIDNKLVTDKDVWIYSAHDLTVASVLNSLGFFEPHIPSYTSSIHFELYRTEEGKHYLQFFYRQHNEEELIPIQFPEYGDTITLEEFHTAYSDIIPSAPLKIACGVDEHVTCQPHPKTRRL